MTTTEQSVSPSPLVMSMQRHPLVWFFGLTMGLTWMYQFLIFGAFRLPLFWQIPVGFVPTLTALFLIARTSGRAGIRDTVQHCFHWRTGWPWYLVVFGSLPVLMLVCTLLVPEARVALQVPTFAAVLTYVPLFLLTLLFFGPIAEEVGWRGFALPRLQQRYGPLVGTLILAGFWGMWHLPLFLFVPGYNGAGEGIGGIVLAFSLFLVFCLPLTILFTWVFNGTHGSLLMVTILHTVNNTSPAGLFLQTLPRSVGDGILKYAFIAGLLVVAVLILIKTRGQLGYEHSS